MYQDNIWLQGGGYIVLILLYIIVTLALIKREIRYSPLSWGMFAVISGSIGVVLYTATRDELVPIVSGFVTAGQCAIALTAWLTRNKNEPLKLGEKIAGILWLVSMGIWWWAQIHSDSSIARVLSIGGMLVADFCAISPILRDGWEKPEEDEPLIWLGFAVATTMIISGSDGTPFTRPGLIYGYYELAISIIMFVVIIFRRKHLKRAGDDRELRLPSFMFSKIQEDDVGEDYLRSFFEIQENPEKHILDESLQNPKIDHGERGYRPFQIIPHARVFRRLTEL